MLTCTCMLLTTDVSWFVPLYMYISREFLIVLNHKYTLKWQNQETLFFMQEQHLYHLIHISHNNAVL